MRISDWSSDVCSRSRPPCLVPPPGALEGGYWKNNREGFLTTRNDSAGAYTGTLHRRQDPAVQATGRAHRRHRSEEHTSELQSLMRISYAVFCLKKKHNI